MEVTHPDLQNYADALEKLAGGWFTRKCGPRQLVVFGVSGNGKTYGIRKLHAWARQHSFHAWDKNKWPWIPSILFVRWPEVADRFKEGEFGIMSDFLGCDLLFIDDIGAEHDTQTRLCADKLCQVLTRRTDNRNQWTVLTTNCEPAAWATRWDERIADRLLRNAQVIDLTQVPSFATI